MSGFLENFHAGKHVSADEMKILASLINVKSFGKGSILLSKGEVSHKTYFVKKGILRSFVIDQKGKEHIFMFAPENWTIGDIVSLDNLDESELFIDVIEDAEVEVFDNQLFEKLNELLPNMAPMALMKLRKRMGVLQKRIIMLMSATAWERYEHFIKTYPDLVQRVPQKMIASYLAVTPEALSKLRSKMQ